MKGTVTALLDGHHLLQVFAKNSLNNALTAVKNIPSEQKYDRLQTPAYKYIMNIYCYIAIKDFKIH